MGHRRQSYRAPRTSAPHPDALGSNPLSAAGLGDRAGEPCTRSTARAYHLTSAVQRGFTLPAWRSCDCSEPGSSCCSGGLDRDTSGRLSFCTDALDDRPGPAWRAGDIATPTRAASSPASPSEAGPPDRASRHPACSMDGRGRSAWTTSSSRPGCGARLAKYEAVYLARDQPHGYDLARLPYRSNAEWVTRFYVSTPRTALWRLDRANLRFACEEHTRGEPPVAL